jgi:hypothetical protein
MQAFVLTPRFTHAVDYAQQIHTAVRKGTEVPYMAHLLGVASLVMGEVGHIPFAVNGGHGDRGTAAPRRGRRRRLAPAA